MHAGTFGEEAVQSTLQQWHIIDPYVRTSLECRYYLEGWPIKLQSKMEFDTRQEAINSRV